MVMIVFLLLLLKIETERNSSQEKEVTPDSPQAAPVNCFVYMWSMTFCDVKYPRLGQLS